MLTPISEWKKRLAECEKQLEEVKSEHDALYDNKEFREWVREGQDIRSPWWDKSCSLHDKERELEDKVRELQIRSAEKKYCNEHLYTDVNPYEVIKEKSDTCWVIREMEAKETQESVEARMESFVPGGFCGHFDNDVQEWVFESNPKNPLVTVRLHKDGFFYTPSGGRFVMNDHPIKIYDFNF